MATAYLRAESVPVILPNNFTQAAAVMAQFDRAQIASAVEVLVNLLDVLDGDPDLERTDAEDDFTSYPQRDWHGPGCVIADPDECVDDKGEGIDEREDDPSEVDWPGHIPGGGT